AEAALGDVELRRGHAEVEQPPVEPVADGIPVREVGEAAAMDRHARVRAELAFGDHDRFGILVHQQQPASGAQALQHATRMSAPPERAIQIRSVLHHPQPVHDLLEQHREVGGPGVRATARHSCRSSMSSPRSASPSVCLICARCACSLHNSNLSPMPTSTAFFSMPTALRWLAGTLMRPLPSGSTKLAAPTSFSCSRRLFFLTRGNWLTWSRRASQTGCGYRYRPPDSKGL